ncbi:hypothetical protein B484DRAFT_442623 [Ochromonadaceae sp. CCMP2298]|nr:hypothetical protein B484DRAFT_442623 [Ochromonadaceae sp. CCMP2298]
MADTAIFDELDLKERIRKYRAARQHIDSERAQLEEEAEALEMRMASLRQEMNVLGSSELVADDCTEESNPEAMKRFRVWNDKLEMKILNQEMRLSLPHLERDAELWEGRSQGMQRATQKNAKDQTRFPSMVMRAAEEIEEHIGALVEERYTLKAQASAAVLAHKRDKAALCSDIAQLRRRLTIFGDEEGPLLGARTKLIAALQLETDRIKHIRMEHIETRQLFESGGEGGQDGDEGDEGDEGGWPLEAFLSLGGMDKRVSVYRAADVLRHWVVPSPDTADLRVDRSADLRVDRFVAAFLEGRDASSTAVISQTPAPAPAIEALATASPLFAESKPPSTSAPAPSTFDLDDRLMGGYISGEDDIMGKDGGGSGYGDGDDEFDRMMNEDLLAMDISQDSGNNTDKASPRASAAGSGASAAAAVGGAGTSGADAKEAYGGSGGSGGSGSGGREAKGSKDSQFQSQGQGQSRSNRYSESKTGAGAGEGAGAAGAGTGAGTGAAAGAGADLSGYIDYKTFRSLCEYLVQNLE